MQPDVLSAAVVAAVGMWATLCVVHHVHSLGTDGAGDAIAPDRHRVR
jgi:hypothetical protein